MDVSSPATLFLDSLQIDANVVRSAFNFNIIAVKGLSVNGYNSIQLHACFDGKRSRSQHLKYNSSTDVVCNFSSTFSLEDHLESPFDACRMDACSVAVYLTAMNEGNAANNDHLVPVGCFPSTRQLVAMAVIDYQTICQYAGNYLSVELFSCSSNPTDVTVMEGATAVSQGVMYVNCSFITSAMDNEASPSLPPALTPINRKAQEREYFRRTLLDQVHGKVQQEHQKTNQTAVKWWAEQWKTYPHLATDRPTHSMKLMAADESGQHRLVCSFVVVAGESAMRCGGESEEQAPLWMSPRAMLTRGGVLSTSPQHCARFVSLLPCSTASSRGITSIMGSGPTASPWLSTMALLCQHQGDIHDHATLLCSLLLGWGMNAFVALGTRCPPSGSSSVDPSGVSERAGQPHCWVVTIESVQVAPDSRDYEKPNNSKSRGRKNTPPDIPAPQIKKTATFWESLTGQQITFVIDNNGMLLLPEKGKHHYMELYVLFRHDSYYLNVQQHPRIPADGVSYVGAPMKGATSGVCVHITDARYWMVYQLPWYMTGATRPSQQILSELHDTTAVPNTLEQQHQQEKAADFLLKSILQNPPLGTMVELQELAEYFSSPSYISMQENQLEAGLKALVKVARSEAAYGAYGASTGVYQPQPKELGHTVFDARLERILQVMLFTTVCVLCILMCYAL